MHHTRQRPPSFVQIRCECVSVCACVRIHSCCASHQLDPTPRRSPIALRQEILNAAHNRPIACHRDSLTERKKRRGRVRVSEALTEVGRRSILGKLHYRLWSSSPQSFSMELVLFCHFRIKKCQVRIMEVLCGYINVNFRLCFCCRTLLLLRWLICRYSSFDITGKWVQFFCS